MTAASELPAATARSAASSPRLRAAMRLAMLAFLAGGCVLHFRATGALVAMTPDWVPWKRAVVLATGPLELALGLGLLVPRLRRWCGILIAAYVVAVWPANIKHAVEHLVLPPVPDSWWYHGPRLALQPVIAWWALYGAEAVDWPFARNRRPE
ncbi:MAG: DoxX family protein [Xanthobacteraceae bacterium]